MALEQKIKQCTELQEQLWAYRPLNDITLKSLRDYYRIGLTYTSNALEGNSLTESETKVIIENGLTVQGKPLNDVFEAVGHAKAYDFMQSLSRTEPVSAECILKLHQFFYEQIDSENAGKYRKVPVFISGSHYSVCAVNKIEPEIEKLMNWYNSHENKLHPVVLAAQLHKRFVFIHPFIDGNGRMARLLMNLALIRNDYNIAIIPAVLRAEYISALEHAHVNDDEFVEFIADREIMTQQDILRLLRENMPLPDKKVNIESQIMEILAAHAGLNAPKIAMMLDRSLRTTQRYLQSLSKKGLVKFKGVAKNGGYFLEK